MNYERLYPWHHAWAYSYCFVQWRRDPKTGQVYDQLNYPIYEDGILYGHTWDYWQ